MDIKGSPLRSKKSFFFDRKGEPNLRKQSITAKRYNQIFLIEHG